jgi:hypothetical protein
MTQFRFVLRASFASFLLLAAASSASAQASRTWVSGVGDDANPCSRTAPCKTFAGAISKTAAGGEIDALDPGGFGAVTITKSITISGAGTFASILASGTNGVVVNAGANDVVTLRGLSINGNGTGLSGIRFLAAGALHVESCDIFNFTQHGIDFSPTVAAQLFVVDTEVRENSAANGSGIRVAPAVGVSAQATLDKVRLDRNRVGLRVQDGSNVTARDSIASANPTAGFFADSTSTAIELNLEHCTASNALTGAGVRSRGAASIVRLSNTTVTGNLNGLKVDPGAAMISFGNNSVAGNGTDGAPTSTIAQL